MMHYNQVTGHAGQDYVFSNVRQKFWIMKGCSVVQRVIRSCFSCRRRNAARGQQIVAHLPKDYLTPDKPQFINVGVDFFGRLFLHHGHSQNKRYRCLFTCLTVRAVHIEVAHPLQTDSFIKALQRFICCRGYPEEIRSNNGTNLVGGE